MKIFRNTLFGLVLLCTSHAYAVPELKLGIAAEKAGGTAFLDLNLSGGTENYAGVNAKIVLPKGVTVTGVSAGGLLNGSFTLGWQAFSDASNDGAIVAAYSGSGSFAASGNLLTLKLQVADSLAPGKKEALFALVNSHALINSRYALSNTAGVSVPLTPCTGYIAVGHADTDGDGISDVWETIIADADPAVSDISQVLPGGDYDSDGSCNIAEFFNSTDPTDTLSEKDSMIGDLNGDQAVTLADTVLALKTAGGIRVPVNPDASVSSPKRIGTPEAVYTLQSVSEMR